MPKLTLAYFSIPKFLRTSLLFFPFASLSLLALADSKSDVVVYGGTSAGVTAAIQAAKMGHSVVLIEPGQHLGGLTSGGLGMTDSGRKDAIGGLSRQFYQRVKTHYQKPEAWKFEKPENFKYLAESADSLWRFEPAVAEKILRVMLAEQSKVTVIESQRLDLKPGVGVTKTKGSISSIRMESGQVYVGNVFIDATYEGDLMAKAGVSYTVGREACVTYDEKLNGVQVTRATKHQFTKPINAYVVPGDPKSGLLPGIQKEGPSTELGADHRVQAYNFRLCMTDVEANKVPWPKPAGYDAKNYELALRYALAGNRTFHSPDRMPNGKTDTNNSGGFSTDNIGKNYGYPDGDYATRETIISEHAAYQQGFYYFLANDPRVPADVRREMSRWGLSKDEFVDNHNWPHQLYIREARRMVGKYVHTEHDCRRTKVTPESVGLGSYNMDSHNVQRYVDAEGHVRNEGDIQESPGGAYMISYQSMVPKENECNNLIVPVCLSSSHIAYGSIRMEPVFMILGQSAATAACLALDGKCHVQDVPYEQLKTRLLADGQVLTPPAGQAASHPGGVSAVSLGGIVVDNAQAKFTGEWVTSNASGSYVGDDYRHDADEAKGEKSCVFTAQLPAAGRYELRFLYPPNQNRASEVAVKFLTQAGPQTVLVDERKVPTKGQLGVTLGTHAFPAGATEVTVSTGGTKGFVVVDAVQFLPVAK